MSTNRTVFISYTTTDKPFAHRLAEDLRVLGFPIWLDVWEMQVGSSIVKEIEEGIDQAAWMIAVLSPDALKSEWVLKELRTGLVREVQECQIFILPAVYKDVKLPAFLRDKFYADFRKSYDTGFCLIKDRLLREYHISSKNQNSWLLVKRPKSFFELMLRANSHENSPYLMSHDIPSEVFSETYGKLEPGQLSHAKSYYEKYTLATPESIVTTWFGDSGRMVLSCSDNKVAGNYDWHGVGLAGKIYGEIINDTIQFQWDWKFSTEKGAGVFWINVPDVLYGGWWMDFEDIDHSAVIEHRISIPNSWQFVALKELEVILE